MSRLASPPLVESLDLLAEEKYRLTHETRGPLVLSIMFTFYGLSVVFVSARTYARVKLSRYAGLDDWLIVASELICTAVVVFIYLQVRYGDGRHFVALSAQDSNNIAKMNFFAVTLWTFSITGTKVSILVQYLRFLPSRKTARLIWFFMAIVVLGGLSTLVVVMTACIPLRALWDTSLQDTAKCLDQRLFWQIQSAYEAVTCWGMLGLLVPPLWRLQLPFEQRVGIIVLLGLSSSSCIASVLRMKSAFDAIPKAANVVHDFTWTGIMATLYAIVELLTGIICCSLPALMPLRFVICPKLFPSRRRSTRPVQEIAPQCASHTPPAPIAHLVLPTPSMTQLTAASPRNMYVWALHDGSEGSGRTGSVDTGDCRDVALSAVVRDSSGDCT
ncbi:hypothetical protein Slin15195_G092940 [Septoria linicola]|uniref:Rhodopsin domain-containing protein n=1 Tax=Septoria linicola TaxID=215465 RepID=A0A9Q9B0L9_9PEZI|nr:hypothetical protein Slin14017_G056060 [Septoria linicola]USW55975.1 hypothetical protein Slin15195_G092940 [Septoria linicola]